MILSKSKIFLLGSLVFCIVSGALGDSSAEQKIFLKDDVYQFELKIQPNRKKIFLNTLGAREPLPDEVSITLYDSQHTGRTVLLQALKVASLGATGNRDQTQYQGRLDPGAGSFVGVELKIGLGTNKAPRIIRWKR